MLKILIKITCIIPVVVLSMIQLPFAIIYWIFTGKIQKSLLQIIYE